MLITLHCVFIKFLEELHSGLKKEIGLIFKEFFGSRLTQGSRLPTFLTKHPVPLLGVDTLKKNFN